MSDIIDITALLEEVSNRIEQLTINDTAEYATAGSFLVDVKTTQKQIAAGKLAKKKKALSEKLTLVRNELGVQERALKRAESAIKGHMLRFAAGAQAQAEALTQEALLEQAIATGDEGYLEADIQVDALPDIAGVSFAERVTYEVIDPNLVPKEYLQVNTAQITKQVRATGLMTEIPGVRVFKAKEIKVRT